MIEYIKANKIKNEKRKPFHIQIGKELLGIACLFTWQRKAKVSKNVWEVKLSLKKKLTKFVNGVILFGRQGNWFNLFGPWRDIYLLFCFFTPLS